MTIKEKVDSILKKMGINDTLTTNAIHSDISVRIYNIPRTDRNNIDDILGIVNTEQDILEDKIRKLVDLHRIKNEPRPCSVVP
jgi:hypothetical protein